MIEVGQLITLNIKYGSSTKSLRVAAGAQIVAKVLFLKDSALGMKKLRRGVAEILGISSISNDYVTEGLEFLKEVGKVQEINNSTWLLTDEARAEVQHILDESRNLLSGVVKRHFSNKFEEEKLQTWFTAAATDFFGHFGDEIVITISRKQKPNTTKYKHINELLAPSIKKNGLADSEKELIEGFVSFISSENPSDERYFMYLIFALFSARLVAADIGVDPFTIDELKNATFILDTNVIFALALEKHKAAKALKALIRSLKKLKSNVSYLMVTREEFNRTIGHIKAEIIGVVREGYSNEILRKTDSPFLRTAAYRMCKTEEDYQRFFGTISDIPDTSELGFKLNRDDSKLSEDVVDAAIKDKKLQDQIQQIKIRQYAERGLEATPKPDSSLQHDAILIYAVENYRKNNHKYWVLSLDKSLQTCAIDRAGPNNLPTVLSLDVLVQVLALDDAGTDVDSGEFAPLLASMILNECLPTEGTYSISDLKTLSSANEIATSFPQDDAEDLLKFIKKNRLEGKTIKNSNAFNLELTRKIEKHIENYDERLQISNKQLSDTTEELKAFEGKFGILNKELISEKTSKIKNSSIRKIGIKSVFYLVLAPAVTYFLAKNIPVEHAALIDYLVAAVPLGLSIWKKFPQLIEEYSSLESIAQDKARIEVEKVLKEQNK